MQTKQAITQIVSPTIKAAEPAQKAATNASTAKYPPAWTNAWGDRPPAELFPREVGSVPNFQAKLAISQPDDPYEQEADQVAEQVMRMPDPAAQVQRKCAFGGIAGPAGECEACAARRIALQRRSIDSTSESSAPPIVNEVLKSESGTSLDSATRSFMESRFGYDFSQVQVHTDAQASRSAQSVNALAYTVGSNVVFREGQYTPGTTEGKRLLAHELTHVVQQSSRVTSGSKPQPIIARAANHTHINTSLIARRASRPFIQRESKPGEASEAEKPHIQLIVPMTTNPTTLATQGANLIQIIMQQLQQEGQQKTVERLRKMPIFVITNSLQVYSADGGSLLGTYKLRSGQLQLPRGVYLSDVSSTLALGVASTQGHQRIVWQNVEFKPTQASAVDITEWAEISIQQLSKLVDPSASAGLFIFSPQKQEESSSKPQEEHYSIEARLEEFKRLVRNAGKARLTNNRVALEQWRQFLKTKLTPGQVQTQILAQETRELQKAAQEGGALATYDQMLRTRNPAMREVQENQIRGRYRACTGCHAIVRAQNWGQLQRHLGPEWKTLFERLETAARQESISPMARPQFAQSESGKEPANAPQRAKTINDPTLPTATAVSPALQEIPFYLQQLGPKGYQVLPAHVVSSTASASQLFEEIQKHIDERQRDYLEFSRRIDSPDFNYLDLRPIVRELLPLTDPEVRAKVIAEIESAQAWETVKAVVVGVATIALLLLTIFPPTSALGVAGLTVLEVGMSGYAVYSGIQSYEQGRLLALGRGASNVLDPEQQEAADLLIAMGILNVVMGTLSFASLGFRGVRLLRGKPSSTGTLGELQGIEAQSGENTVRISGLDGNDPQVKISAPDGKVIEEGSITGIQKRVAEEKLATAAKSPEPEVVPPGAESTPISTGKTTPIALPKGATPLQAQRVKELLREMEEAGGDVNQMKSELERFFSKNKNNLDEAIENLKNVFKKSRYAKRGTQVKDIRSQIEEDIEAAGKQGVRTELPEGTGKEFGEKTFAVRESHDIGVVNGRARAIRDKLKPSNWENPYSKHGGFGKGFDDIMFDANDNPVIIEYKGGESPLGPDQMTNSWIKQKIAELRGPLGDSKMADILEKALNEGKLTGRLYRTRLDANGKALDTQLEHMWKYEP